MEMSSLVVLFCIASTVNAVKWVNCPGVTLKGVVTDLKIPGCETTPICVLKKGANASIEIDFKINEDTKTAKSVVHGIIAGVPIPFGLDNPDVCSGSGVTCPLTSGSAYTYKTYIYVRSEYPSLSLKVRWEIKDDTDNDVACIELPAKLALDNRTPKNSALKDSRMLFRSRQL